MAIREVPIELGGGSHALRLDLGAWADLEDQGFDLATLVDEFQTAGRRFRATRALVWAMLQHEDNPPSLKDVGAWIDGHNYLAILPKIGEALRDAFPNGNGKSSPPVAAGTGQSSSGSPTAPSSSRRKGSGA